MVIASFQIHNKSGRVRFFLETFLVPDKRIDIVLGMLFLTFCNIDIRFAKEDFT